MSKRAQTTGAPKRRRRDAAAPAANEPVAKNQAESDYKSRAAREERLQRLVIRGVIVVVAILALLVGIAFAVEQLIVPNQVVAMVNGEQITVDQFRAEYNLEKNRLLLQLNQVQSAGYDMQQLSQQEPYRTWISEANVPDQLGLRVINDMVDDRLIAQEAAKRNISVNEAAVQMEIQEFFGYDPTAVALIGVDPTETPEPTITPTPYVSPTPTTVPTITPIPTPSDTDEDESEVEAEPTITPQPTVVEPTLSAAEVFENFEESQESYRSYFSINGVSDESLDAFFERLALETLLADDLLSEDSGLLYADVRHILVEEEEEANAALLALQAGESFADLARAISTDTGSGTRGGELGETFVGNYVPEFRAAIESAEIGALVGPVKSEFGYHVLQVRSKEQRSGDELAGQLQRAKEVQLQQFIEALREESDASIEIYDSWLDNIPRR